MKIWKEEDRDVMADKVVKTTGEDKEAAAAAKADLMEKVQAEMARVDRAVMAAQETKAVLKVVRAEEAAADKAVQEGKVDRVRRKILAANPRVDKEALAGKAEWAEATEVKDLAAKAVDKVATEECPILSTIKLSRNSNNSIAADADTTTPPLLSTSGRVTSKCVLATFRTTMSSNSSSATGT